MRMLATLLFATLEKQFSRERWLPEACLALSVFSAQVKCGNFYLNFFNY